MSLIKILKRGGFKIKFEKPEKIQKGRKSRKVDGIQKAFGATKYSDAIVFDAYEAARSGLCEEKIAGLLGITRICYNRWKEQHKLFGLAIEKGMAVHKKVDGSDVQLKEYVYKQLDPKLQKLWREINSIENGRTTTAKLDAIFEQHGVRARQHLFIHALIVSNFNPSQALRKLGLSRKVVEMWAERDPNFGVLLKEIEWHKGNFFESALVGSVKAGDTGAILFANRTFNKNRGYGIKIEHEVSGQVNHLHVSVDVENLKLDLDTKRKLLEAIQAQEATQPKMLGYTPEKTEEIIDAEFETKEAG